VSGYDPNAHGDLGIIVDTPRPILFTAHCLCGWTGPVRLLLAAAEEDLPRHIENEGIQVDRRHPPGIRGGEATGGTPEPRDGP
jgi:hypothetical protein